MADDLTTAEVPQESRKAPVEIRSAAIDSINTLERIVTVIAVPYEQHTQVPYRGEIVDEVIQRGAFDGIETRPTSSSRKPTTVNRDHDKRRLVGKIVNYYPDRNEGLIVDAYISDTELGNETLQLAKDGILGGSVGMAVRPSDQTMERRNGVRTRKIRRAFLDHLALVPDPAYQGAEILAVREDSHEEVDLPNICTPRMDEYADDPVLAWMFERAAAIEQRASGDGSKPYGDVAYADPGYQEDKKKRYPIDTEEHVRAAWSYINQADNAAKYSSEHLAAIKGRIKSAAKKFGITISDSSN